MKSNQIAIGSVLSYLQQFLGMILGLVYTPVMIHLLGQSEYGLYNTVASVTTMLSVLNMGFSSSYIRYYSQKKNEGKDETAKINGMFLTVFLVISVIAAICGWYLLTHLELVFDRGLTVEEYTTARKLMAVLMIQLTLSFPMYVFSSIIYAHEKFVFAKTVSILKTLLNPMLTLPLLIMGYGSVAMVCTSLAVSLVADSLNIYYVLVVLKEKFRIGYIDKIIFQDMLVYTLFIAMHLIADQINWNVDKVLLGRFRGTRSVAVYSVGYTLFSHYVYLGVPISSMFIPKVHGIVADSALSNTVRREKLTETFVTVGRIQYLILGCVATGFAVFGRQFLELWVGPEYKAAYWVAMLLISSGTIDLIQHVGIEIQRAQNLHKFRAVVYLMMGFANVLISISLCQKYDAVGSAIGTALSFLLTQGIIINVYYQKKCNLDVLRFWKSILSASRGMILPLLTGVAICKFFDQSTWVSLILANMVYAVLYLFSMIQWGMTQTEKSVLQAAVKKIIGIVKC